VIYANTSKSNQNKFNINANENQIIFTQDLTYLDHSLPPLGLFLQIKFIFQEWNWSSVKNSPFSHNQNSPPQETKFCNKSILDKSKILTLLLLKFTSGSWSICFGLNFSPFGMKHQNGIIFGPLTPLPHQKCQFRAKRQLEHKNELGSNYTNTGVQWKSLHRPSPHFSFNAPFRLHQVYSNNQVSLKRSSCNTSPP
jgi:hypothetical protein